MQEIYTISTEGVDFMVDQKFWQDLQKKDSKPVVSKNSIHGTGLTSRNSIDETVGDEAESFRTTTYIGESYGSKT